MKKREVIKLRLETSQFNFREAFTKLASLCGEIDGSLDENSAEYIRNLLVKAIATIRKLQSQPSSETTDHPLATVTGEKDSKASIV